MAARTRSLFVYTDASVRGELYRDPFTGKSERSRVGPSTAGCVGWVRRETSTTAVVKGAVRLGCLGPNRAEYEALIFGLEESRVYMAEASETVSHLLMCSDSAPVLNTLTHRKDARELAPLRAKAREVQAEIEDLGVAVNYEYVRRSNPWHRQAHQLADAARRRF